MITEDELTTLLSAATADVEASPVRVEELISSGRHRRRRLQMYAGSAAAAAVALAGTLAVTTPWSSDSPARAPISSTGTCLQNIPSRVLPSWARTGFSERRPKLPHVVGKNHEIAALVFGQPLTAAPRSAGPTNKILWVAHSSRIRGDAPSQSTPLVIRASLEDGSLSVVRTVAGGPGPSILDLPAAGCWQLDLSWGAVTDSLSLYYAPD